MATPDKIFALHGQSNATGADAANGFTECSAAAQKWLNASVDWADLDEPIFGGATGNSLAGSFCNEWIARNGGTVGFVGSASSGKGVADTWSHDDNAVYTAAVAAIIASGCTHLDGLVFWGGEQDVANEVAKADFKTAFALYLSNLRRDLAATLDNSATFPVYIVLPWATLWTAEQIAMLVDGFAELAAADSTIKIVQDSSNFNRIDTVHVDRFGQDIIGQRIAFYITEGEFMADETPVFAHCAGSAALNIKTGAAPTISIGATGIATFSVAQTNSLMGVGLAISYNDGAPKKCYVAPAGKVSTTQWGVLTATGELPAECTDASVASIGFDYESLNAAIAGCVDASHLNSVSLITSNIPELHLPMYCLQDAYTADTTAAVVGGIAQNATHRIKIYAPSNTATECNLTMKPTTAKWDATKPRFEVSAAHTISIPNVAGNESLTDFYDLQIHNSYTTAATSSCIYVDRQDSYPTVRRCIFWMEHAAALRIGIFLNRGTTRAIITDNIGFVKGGAGGSASALVRISNVTGDADINGNTAYSFYNPFYATGIPTAGWERSVKNNLFIGCSGIGIWRAGDVHDYNTYDRDESEANGTLTAQGDTDIFTDFQAAAIETTDWQIKKTADAAGAGTNLGVGYDGDFLHAVGSGWRTAPIDCGAVELAAQSSGGAVKNYLNTGLVIGT